jgi:YHS domain-containing protein
MKTTIKLLMLAGLLASVAYAIGAADKPCADCVAMTALAETKPAEPAKPVEPAKPATPAAPAVPAKKPYPLTTCLVSDEKLGEMGKPFVYDHKGREVQFCCKNCKKDFLKDPAKYLKILDEAEKKAAPAEPSKPAEPAKPTAPAK